LLLLIRVVVDSVKRIRERVVRERKKEIRRGFFYSCRRFDKRA